MGLIIVGVGALAILIIGGLIWMIREGSGLIGFILLCLVVGFLVLFLAYCGM